MNIDITQARETLAELKETTWSVMLREIDGARFVVPSADSLDDPPWPVDGRAAVTRTTCAGPSTTSRGWLVSSAAQSRNDQRMPCTTVAIR